MKLTKDQRDRLLMTAVITVMGMGLCYQFLVRGSLAAMDKQEAAVFKAQKRFEDATKVLDRAAELEAELKGNIEQLEVRESGMAPPIDADAYGWSDRLVREFAKDRGVEIREVRPPESKGVEMFPTFPYSAVSFRVRGVASYWNLGSFLADFENAHPGFCVRDLELSVAQAETAGGRSAGDKRGASPIVFQFSVVVPTKPQPI